MLKATNYTAIIYHQMSGALLLLLFTDSSWKNIEGKCSQGGYVLFRCDQAASNRIAAIA